MDDIVTGALSGRSRGPAGGSSTAARALRWLLLLALCSAYLQGGIMKALAFDAVLPEFERLGLHPAYPLLVATILLEVGASVLILLGYRRRGAAIALAVFTIAATLVANRFWSIAMPDRVPAMNAFFEHLGLAAAFILLAWTERTP